MLSKIEIRQYNIKVKLSVVVIHKFSNKNILQFNSNKKE
jgi:hypothetical protein